MVKNIVVHLGDHKTGSTSIQNALANGLWVSPSVSICYPAAINHNHIAKTMLRAKHRAPRKARLEKLAARLQESDADIGVISAEEFERVLPRNFRQYFSEFFPEHIKNLRLIVYVRPHAERLLSSYSERTKQGLFTGSLSQFHDATNRNDTFRYVQRLQSWRENFGDRLTVRPMIDTVLQDQDVVKDFFAYLLQGHDFSLLRSPQKNVSLSRNDLEMLQIFHGVYEGPATADSTRAVIGRHFARILARHQAVNAQPVTLGPKLAEKIRTAYMPDAKSLDDAFFVGSPMQKALLSTLQPKVNETSQAPHKSCLSPAERRIINAWSQLVARIAYRAPHVWSQHLNAARVQDDKVK